MVLSGTEARSGEREFLEALAAGSLPAFERLFTENGDRMNGGSLRLVRADRGGEDLDSNGSIDIVKAK